MQRAISTSLMAEIAYVGTSGVGLLTASNINAALPGTTDPTLRQPFGPALGEIRELSNSAHSTYNGLQSKLEKRFSRGVYFLGSYTWSKSIDNQSNGTDTAIASGQYPQDPRNPGLDRGLIQLRPAPAVCRQLRSGNFRLDAGERFGSSSAGTRANAWSVDGS